MRAARPGPLAVVGVTPVESYQRLKRLFDALSGCFPVTFEARASGETGRLNGFILLGGTRERALATARAGVGCYAVLAAGEDPGGLAGSTVHFADSPSLPLCLRNRSLEESKQGQTVPLRSEAGDEVMAARSNHAIWIRSTEAGRDIHLVSMEPPTLSGRAFLSEYFNGERFMALLPLLQYLREITRGLDWQPAPLRACFVFDDPSLHWPSYGCLRYAELAKHAEAHHYHAVIATIPLDAWWVNSHVAALFRLNPARLSLAMHGNEHTWLEMARTVGEADRLAMLAGALRRVQSLEARHNLKVCRVMEAPHGMVDCEMFDTLVGLGFEAALITAPQFLQCNQPKPCPATFGMDAAASQPGGLGGIPRLVMSSRWKTEAALAAFLGQPVVIAGHHQNADDGMSMLKEFAATVNGFGPVEWCNLTRISRTQYKTKRDGNNLVVRMGSRRIAVRVPEGVQTITVERPWLNEGDEERLVMNSGVASERVFGQMIERLSVRAEGTIELISHAPMAFRLADAPVPRRRIWPVLRRVLTETRDRAYPYLAGPMRKRASNHGTAPNSPP